jgi:2-polyprenyl-6-methoxyphenol hydroxylase-like FAD-dependent oxidoreductase
MTLRNIPRIAIVGAGPGGLTCARVLQLAGIAATVYDADAALTARDQGGTLDIHADSGRIALQDARLGEAFAALARPEGQSKRLLDPSGAVLREHIADDAADAAPEIDRGQLRGLLADALTPGSIRWGHRVLAVRPGHDGTHVLEFSDGAPATVDLVIGADGAWSRVRPLLTDAAPRYTGVSFVELTFDDVDVRHPAIAALVGSGHMWANGDGHNIILQRNSGGHVRGYLGMRAPLDWLYEAGLGAHDGRGGIVDANGVQALDADRVKAVLLKRFADFAPALLRVIRDSEGQLTNRPIFALPAPLSWPHRTGATLLGDAAHLMAPFGGEGVNLAMLDGAELGRAIAGALTAAQNLDDALLRYERRMIARSEPVAAGANTAIVDHFAAGGVDPDDVPDFAVEAERWKAAAAAYRTAQDR